MEGMGFGGGGCARGRAAGTNGDGFVDLFDDDLSVYAFENGW